MPKPKLACLYAAAISCLSATVLAHSQSRVADLEGVWSTTLTTRAHPGWLTEDHLCGFFCSADEYQHLRRLLMDPANDNRSLQELQQDTRTFGRLRADEILTDAGRERLAALPGPVDTSEACEPPDLRAAAFAPLPLAIEVHEGNVVLHQQHWNVARTFRLTNESPNRSGPLSLYGNATARFEGPTLVVETVNLLPMMTGDAVTTSQARVTERYTPNGSRLDLELTIIDPATYREPRVWYQPRIRTPDVQLVEDDPCAGLREQG